MMQILSLGAGVQSTTMVLMALAGEIEPMPDAAIFADTGWEPRAVYEHLDWLEAQMQGRIPLYRVSVGNIRDDLLAAKEGGRFVSIPAYSESKEGKAGMGRRQCTREYKIAPIIAKERELLGFKPRQRVVGVHLTQWIGISLDEATRMKPSRESWKQHRWPLIEQRMTRHSCLLWLESHGYPTPPKSACIGCPFHGDRTWRAMRDGDPQSWQEAVDFDHQIRRLPGMKRDNFLHKKLIPLELVDLSTPQENGQLELDDYTAECEGMCGV